MVLETIITIISSSGIGLIVGHVLSRKKFNVDVEEIQTKIRRNQLEMIEKWSALSKSLQEDVNELTQELILTRKENKELSEQLETFKKENANLKLEMKKFEILLKKQTNRL